MKKKAIEKIPYLILPKVSRKKVVKYIGVTAFKVVAHERHLFLEVYRNDKACKSVPVVRIVLNEAQKHHRRGKYPILAGGFGADKGVHKRDHLERRIMVGIY